MTFAGLSITLVSLKPTQKCIQFKLVSVGPKQCDDVMWEGPAFVNKTVDITGKADVVIWSEWEELHVNMTGRQ